MPTPFIGQVVHYVAYGSAGGEYPKACRAATVTAVHPGLPGVELDAVSVCVLTPTGVFFNDHIRRDDHGTAGTWHHSHAGVWEHYFPDRPFAERPGGP